MESRGTSDVHLACHCHFLALAGTHIALDSGLAQRCTMLRGPCPLSSSAPFRDAISVLLQRVPANSDARKHKQQAESLYLPLLILRQAKQRPGKEPIPQRAERRGRQDSMEMTGGNPSKGGPRPASHSHTHPHIHAGPCCVSPTLATLTAHRLKRVVREPNPMLFY